MSGSDIKLPGSSAMEEAVFPASRLSYIRLYFKTIPDLPHAGLSSAVLLRSSMASMEGILILNDSMDSEPRAWISVLNPDGG
jgi:hypothetical protein